MDSLRGGSREAALILWSELHFPPINLDTVRAAWQSRAAGEDRRTLDERTWTDLNLDDTFVEINRTASTLGQAALYHRLRCAPAADHLGAFEALVARMTTDASARDRAQRALGRLHDAHGYDIWWLARPDAVEIRSWYVICPVLTAAVIALIPLTVIWHGLAGVLVPVLVLTVAITVFTARDVVDLRRAVRQLAPIIATGERLTSFNDEAAAPITGTLENDVKRLRRLKTIARWASEDPFMLSGTTNIALEALSQLVSALYEYINMALLLDGNAIYFAHRDLAAHGDAVVRVAAAIGEIDAALSVSAWRSERDDWTRPAFEDAGAVTAISGIRHPLVADAVPNDVSLTPGRGLLITGSNMSGKSTFLRTVGISIVLAQTIHTCLAKTYRAPVIDVQSCIGRADDLVSGKSYYLVEVEQVVNRLRASDGQASHLFIFDELFRGTNAIERIAAGEAVLRQVLRAGGAPKPHVVLAATHDAELVGLLADLYDPWHFTDTVTDEGLSFDYRLQAGPAKTRNAITLLALHGAPEAVVTRALASAIAIERQRDAAQR